MVAPSYNAGMGIADVLKARVDSEPGLTQQAVAARFGVQQATVNRWLWGKSVPEDNHVDELIDFTGLNRDQVLAAIHTQRRGRRPQLDDLLERITALEVRCQAIGQVIGMDKIDRALASIEGKVNRSPGRSSRRARRDEAGGQ